MAEILIPTESITLEQLRLDLARLERELGGLRHPPGSAFIMHPADASRLPRGPLGWPQEVGGARVYRADPIRVQVRFPKSKKRRIRKKWAKRPENWAIQDVVPPGTVYLVRDPGALFAPPDFRPRWSP